MPTGIYIRTEYHKNRIKESYTTEVREKISESQKARFENVAGTFLGKSHSEETKNKISLSKKGTVAWNRGLKDCMSEKGKQRMVESKIGSTPWNKDRDFPQITGEKNCNWKGDEVGYSALHDWIQSQLGTPDTCENCEQSGLTGHQIHWHNIGHEYKRNLTDWMRLCAKCHKKEIVLERLNH